MYTKTVKFYGYDDKEHQQTLHFALNFSDILDINAMYHGGLVNMIDDMVKNHDFNLMYAFIDALIIKSYGKPNKDKTEFDKSLAVKTKFLNSAAYQTYLRTLLHDGNEFNKFFEGIFPKDIREEIKQINDEKRTKNPFEFNIDFTKKTIFDDLSNLGFKLKGEEDA